MLDRVSSAQRCTLSGKQRPWTSRAYRSADGALRGSLVKVLATDHGSIVFEHTSETNVVVVHQPVDGLDFSTNIVFLRLVEQVLYGRMLLVTSKDLLGLFLPASRSVTLRIGFHSTVHTCWAGRHHPQ
jgi:hypothetical protein